MNILILTSISRAFIQCALMDSLTVTKMIPVTGAFLELADLARLTLGTLPLSLPYMAIYGNDTHFDF